jgi:hypothetical protein
MVQHLLSKKCFLSAILLELQMIGMSQPKQFIQSNMPYDCCRHISSRSYSVERAWPVNFNEQEQRVIDES